MQQGIVEIVLNGFEKWKARKDVENPSWFRCSNRVFDDDDLFEFSLEEMAVWWYIMALASQQQSSHVRIHLRKASTRISPDLMLNTISKLKEIGIVHSPDDVTATLRGRNADVTSAGSCQKSSPERPRAEDRTRDKKRREKKEEIRVVGEPPAATAPDESLFELKNGAASQGGPEPTAPTPRKSFGVIDSLRGDDTRELVLDSIHPDTQKTWAKRYEINWLKEKIDQCIEYYIAETNAEASRIDQWGLKLTTWLRREKKPALAHPSVFSGHPCDRPLTAKEEAREDMRHALGDEFTEEAFEEHWRQIGGEQ